MSLQQSLMFQLDTPQMATLEIGRCKTKPINHTTAAGFVERYHYAHRSPSIVAGIGMYVDDVLAGVITYGIPPNRNALSFCGEEYVDHALELNRLCIHDWAGRNSESWLIGQSFDWLRKMWPEYFLLISYADPMHDHIGYIYQATNWIYTGESGLNTNDLIVNGERMTGKNIFNAFGTNDKQELIKRGAIIQAIASRPKHRYIYILKKGKERKDLLAKVKWAIKPYPKKETVTQ